MQTRTTPWRHLIAVCLCLGTATGVGCYSDGGDDDLTLTDAASATDDAGQIDAAQADVAGGRPDGSGEETAPPPGCGDGELATDEACEGFDLRGETCQSQGFHGGQLACTDACRLDTSSCTGKCGDGELNGPEACDDGDTEGGYGCNANCTGKAEAYCGDGTVNGPERCDGDQFAGDDCESLGFAMGTPSCDSNCEVSGCYDEAKAVAAGYEHSCAIWSDGSIGCWGDRDEAPSGAFRQIDAGIEHTCAIAEDGSLECWGKSGWSVTDPPSGQFTRVSTGHRHACAVAEDGHIECWGDKDGGETTPPSGSFKRVTAGRDYNCAIADDGSITCWGTGAPDRADLPSGTYRSIAISRVNVCTVSDDGEVGCSMGFPQGEIPSGTFTDVEVGGIGVCALSEAGEIECWGYPEAPLVEETPSGTFTDLERADTPARSPATGSSDAGARTTSDRRPTPELAGHAGVATSSRSVARSASRYDFIAARSFSTAPLNGPVKNFAKNPMIVPSSEISASSVTFVRPSPRSSNR